MDLLRVESSVFFTQRSSQKLFVAITAIFATTGFLMGGCTSPDTSTKGSSAPPVQAGQPGAAKPTAEQEAARQRGEAMGPAIQAANEAGPK